MQTILDLKNNIENTTIKAPRNWVTGIGLLFWSLYFFSIFFPESLWGLHYIAFLPPFLKYGILTTSLLSILYFHFNTLEVSWASKLNSKKWIFVIAIFAAFFYYNFPMEHAFYGDAELFQKKIGERTTEYSSTFTNYVLGFDVKQPKTGNTTVLSIVRLFSYQFSITHKAAFRLVGIITGFFFAFICSLFLNATIKNYSLKILLMLLAIVAPFAQLFMGQQEIYAPSFPAVAAYLTALILYFKSGKKLLLISLPILFVICLKFHFVFILLMPSLMMAFFYHFRHKTNWISSFFVWKKILLFVLIPIILIGTYAYFFVFKDYNDPRFLNLDVDIYTRLFLPIVSPEAPLDNYNLFSWNHIFDYFNMFFLWSGAALFILLVIVLFFKKHINWNQPQLIVIGLTLILFMMVFFAFNPLMSMPVDCDLFSLTAPIFLFFVFTLCSQLDNKELTQSIAGTSIALTLLTLPIYLVNSDDNALSYRLENLSKHVFKTYWIQGAGGAIVGIDMMNHDPELKLKRYLKLLDELAPYANKNEDAEYAVLLFSVAKIYRNELKDYEKALIYHKKAKGFAIDMKSNYWGLTEANFLLENFEEAYQYSLKLIEFYPNQSKALGTAIDCAISAKHYNKALKHMDDYLAKWESDDLRKMKADLVAKHIH